MCQESCLWATREGTVCVYCEKEGKSTKKTVGVNLCTLSPQVTTVDRYQGQQNDYIILSLVRTKHVGHLRDVRRLVVAMSRARLGLYVLARVSLFRGCTELQPAFKLVGGGGGTFAVLALKSIYLFPSADEETSASSVSS